MQREDGCTDDHGTDVLGGGALEQVGTTAGAVSDVVADQVSDDGRVAGIVLGNACLHLSDEVSAHIGSLGVDTAAQLCEQSGEGGTEGVSDGQGEGHLDQFPIRSSLAHDAGGGELEIQEEYARDSQEGQRDHGEAGHGTAAERGLERLVEGAPRRAGGTDVRVHGHEHANVAGQGGEEGAEQEGCADKDAPRHVLILHSHPNGDDHRENHANYRNRLILSSQIGHCSFAYGIPDLFHIGSAGVLLEDAPSKVTREEQAYYARDWYQIDQFIN